MNCGTPKFAGGPCVPGKGLAVSPDVDHGAGWLEKSRLADVVTRFLSFNGTQDVGFEFPVVGAGAQAAVEVVFDL